MKKILGALLALIFLCLGGGEAGAAALLQQPDTWRFLPTTRQSVILTLGGLSQAEPLRAVLDMMQADGMRGTFFVTERELKRNSSNIELIRAYGMDLGLGLATVPGGTVADYREQIRRLRQEIQSRYGLECRVARQMAKAEEAEAAAMREAVLAEGCLLVGQGLNIVQSKHKSAATAAEVMQDIFGKWVTSLDRGEIIYLRTDFYENQALAAQVLHRVKQDKIDNIAYRHFHDSPEQNPANDSAYRVESLADVLADREHSYEFPVAREKLPRQMLSEPYKHKLEPRDFQEEFFRRYIGAPGVSEDDRMLKFTRREMQLADKSGVVKTVADNTVFLTFDDWGHDESINKLLYVLRKHHVPATFFIITRNMPTNPNLLRAVAGEGHEIGSHTDQHVPMSKRDERGHYAAVETAEEYREDVASSYEKLLDTVGDMELRPGRPALTRLLRPPTLAVSREGCQIILEEGYSYIVNGYGSTEDYGAVSLQSLVGIIENILHDKEHGQVRRGAIAIMHMSSTAPLTAQALDIVLEANEQRPEGDPNKFKVGLLGDYLTGDYDQRMRQVQPLPPLKK